MCISRSLTDIKNKRTQKHKKILLPIKESLIQTQRKKNSRQLCSR